MTKKQTDLLDNWESLWFEKVIESKGDPYKIIVWIRSILSAQATHTRKKIYYDLMAYADKTECEELRLTLELYFNKK